MPLETEKPSTKLHSSLASEDSAPQPDSDRQWATILMVFSVASFVFWLIHSFALRNAIEGVRILAGMRH